jgi:hypothetical protein
MSDFESRLRETLAERADAAPDAHGLADGARRRLRRRRTTWAVVAGAAVVAAAVPLGLGQLGPEGGSDGVEDSGVAGDPVPQVESGYRTESWHDVTFEVPVDWGYGGTTAWCTAGAIPAEVRPVITRPDTGVARIRCSPGSGYGVTIGSATGFDAAYASGHVWQYDAAGVEEVMYPDGAWLGFWYDTDTVVTVVAQDRDTARRVVDSVHEIEEVDANECPPRVDDAMGRMSSTSDALSICRFDEVGWLTASRRLVGRAAERADEAIFSTPDREGGTPCPDGPPAPSAVVLKGGGYIATVVTDAACEGDNGVFLSGAVREVDDGVRRALDLTRLP